MTSGLISPQPTQKNRAHAKDHKHHIKELPLQLELRLTNKKHLKRDVWENARRHGWL